MPTPSLNILISVLFIIIINVGCIGQRKQQVFRSDESLRGGVSGKVLFVPIDTITSEYLDNTALYPEVELSDSFYCNAANNLILYQCSKIFAMRNVQVLEKPKKLIKWTSFSNDTIGKQAAAVSIRDLTASAGADYLLSTYSCSITQSSVRQEGWRKGKYSGSYERPIAYKAIALVHVQLWNKNGVLIYENRSHGNSGKPILYNTIKKRYQSDNTDVVNYSKKLFSPPLLRALNEAVRNVLVLH